MIVLLALVAPVLLVLLALTTVAVRDRCGGCRAHQRFAALRSGRLGVVEGE
jgi:hypothetical protein